ncbi:MAG: LacI family DNA-binding transcriptional regulator [Cognatishimia sp.]|uniref:LacI family DNA-binding transcriptional regulator n=1 Tax=Cognatishimia sp. TaxID=2211648 RepID=UPI003B8C5F23
MNEKVVIPKLDDVARVAGVSTATVSRCLNTPDRVAKATLDKVMKTVEELGYTPHFGARVMAAKRTFTVGAIIPTMENAIFARGLQAFQEELHKRGFTLLVSSSGYQPEVEKEQIRTLVARGADALLLIGYDREPEIYEFLRKRNVPVFVAWAYAPEHDLPSIGFDNLNAMCRLAQKVIDFGHRKIAVISGIIEGNDRAFNRLEGIKNALRQNGLDVDQMKVVETNYGIENGARALEQILSSTNPPTAVMCGNDVLAVGALRYASKAGLRVPEDISITGFDDIELASIVTPTLTTVHVPHREMGRKAATELANLVEGIAGVRMEELETSLRIRDSLGAPPA